MQIKLDVNDGVAPVQPAVLPTDANWHTIVISHYYAAGKTYIYFDGIQQSVADGKMLLSKVNLGGDCKVSDLHFWRAGMNADEVAAFEAGKMLCSSLELYCPLNNDNIDNIAQSTNGIQLVEEEPTSFQQIANDQIGNTSSVFTILGQPADESFRGTVLIVDGKKVIR